MFLDTSVVGSIYIYIRLEDWREWKRINYNTTRKKGRESGIRRGEERSEFRREKKDVVPAATLALWMGRGSGHSLRGRTPCRHPLRP